MKRNQEKMNLSIAKQIEPKHKKLKLSINIPLSFERYYLNNIVFREFVIPWWLSVDAKKLIYQMLQESIPCLPKALIYVLLEKLLDPTTMRENYIDPSKTIEIREPHVIQHHEYELNVKHGQCIGFSLRNNMQLTSLLLPSQRIGDIGACAIAAALLINTTLTVLNLRENQIGYLGSSAMGNALRFNTILRELILQGNEFGDIGSMAIAQAILKNTGLRKLNLAANTIGDIGTQSIGKALIEKVNTKTLIILKPYTIGFHFEHNRITTVDPKSQADHLGISIGWEILEINGEIQSNNSELTRENLKKMIRGKKDFSILFDTAPKKLSTWSCNACMHLNTPNTNICLLCTYPKQEERHNWKYTTCTFENDASSSTCAIPISNKVLDNMTHALSEGSIVEIDMVESKKKGIVVGQSVDNCYPIKFFDAKEVRLYNEKRIRIVNHHQSKRATTYSIGDKVKILQNNGISIYGHIKDIIAGGNDKILKCHVQWMQKGKMFLKKVGFDEIQHIPEKYFINCEKNHVLSFSSYAMNGYRFGWICDRCRLRSEGERWLCQICHYDVCKECISVEYPNNSYLTILRMEENNIGDYGGSQIGNALETNTTLTKLTLYRNKISDIGAIAIGKSLVENQNLTFLALGENEIRDAGARSIGRSLITNTTLLELNLFKNIITTLGARDLSDMLKTNSTLTGCYLAYNMIGEEGIKKLNLVRENRCTKEKDHLYGHSWPQQRI